ncbi:hypothetical protein NMG60_11026480 [Bertholletia excelsa]
MAISSYDLLRLSILLGLLSISARARPGREFHPCNAFFIFSTIDRNSDVSKQYPPLIFSGRQFVTFFFTDARDVNLDSLPEPEIETESTFLPSRPEIFLDRPKIDVEDQTLPFGFYSLTEAAFRDRTKDILNVIGSLLFGVGCGALTATTLYLVWALFSSNRYDPLESDYEKGDIDYDVNPKKMGYVAIPAPDAPVPAPPAKEVV